MQVEQRVRIMQNLPILDLQILPFQYSEQFTMIN